MDSQARITQSDLECNLHDKDSEPELIQLSLLEKITNDFSDNLVIGRGGFAVVYKGKLENVTVAVKKLLPNAYKYHKEFLREVDCLTKAKHKNVVQFLGYCADSQGNVGSFEGNLVMANTNERLLCFEYLPKGSLQQYIKDASEGLEWRQRYKIIKGICEGLNYLHHENIMHLDLKPDNILLDEDMTPKITDFGLSRCLEEDQTRIITTKVGGTLGYLAPESSSHQITPKFDLYSLGVIIIEMLTGKKGYQAVEDVLGSWSNRLERSQGSAQWKQIRVCAEIGMECTNFEPARRPESMNHIINRLVATESGQSKLADNPSELLGVHKFALCFPFEPNKSIPCSLHLTNNTDEPVAFRLRTNGESCESLVRLPLYGIVPPRSPYILIVIARQEKELPQKRSIDLILESTRLGDKHNQPDDRHFESTKEMGNVVCLKAVYTRRRETMTPSKAFLPGLKIMYCAGELYTRCLYSLDTNQAKQWIIVGEDKGHVRIWNYRTQGKVDSIKVSEEKVRDVKFIARKQWFVAGTDNGYVHVYSYETKMQKITSIKLESRSNLSLAVHPTRPYLLSSSCRQMKLWDWDKEWDCIQIFEEEHSDNISQVAFNTNDTIASTSEDHTVKVWCVDSPKSNYTLSGHSNKVNCLDFFTCADQEYLVTGSDDRTGKIWDMQRRMCVNTLEGFVSPVMSVIYQPTVHRLITGSKDGLVYLWRTNNIRICSSCPNLERIIDTGCGGPVCGLACLMRGIVIGNEEALATMDIEQSADDYSESYTTRSGDTTCKVVTADSNSQQPILDVHPLELHFLLGRGKHMTCSLHLTNKTDEVVDFMLIDKRGNNHRPQYLAELPLHGIVPPGSSYTLGVKTVNDMEQQEVMEPYLVLQSTILGDKYIVPFADQFARDDYFGEAKQLGHVHEVSLNAIYTPTVLPQEPISLGINILDMGNWYKRRLYSLDANQAKQWIITGGSRGHIGIWNYQTQRKVDSLKLSRDRAVSCVKFIARNQWFVAATEHGDVHVYNYESNLKKIMRISVGYQHGCPVSLAVHPTRPYLLTLSGQEIVLWDWDKGWERIEITTRHEYREIYQLTFSSKDIIAFAPNGHTVEVWSIDSRDNRYTLPGHSDTLNCLDFFTCGGQEYLVSGSNDRTAKIWDTELKVCLHTLEAFRSPVLSATYQPNLHILITGLEDGLIYLWSTTDSRISSRSIGLERIVNIGYGGAVRSLACSMGRVVIGKEDAVAILDIKNKNDQDKSTDYTEPLYTTSGRLGDITSQVMVASQELLEVHPLELHFHYDFESDNHHNVCSLLLTNKRNEHVAFRVTNKRGKMEWAGRKECLTSFVELPIWGIVPPRSICHLIVKPDWHACLYWDNEIAKRDLVEPIELDLVMQSTISGDKNTVLLAEVIECSQFFNQAKECGHAVHEVALKCLYFGRDGGTPVETVIPTIMKITPFCAHGSSSFECLDVHPTEPWILAGYEESIRIWKCDSKKHLYTFRLSPSVMCIKGVPRTQRIVAQTSDSLFHVYDCATRKKVLTLGAPVDKLDYYAIAFHPTKPYVLSTTTKLWESDKGWECTPAFGSGVIRKLAFNPEDPNSFATLSADGKIEVWTLDTSEPNYHISGHSEKVISLAFFGRGDVQYLITGSDDCTAKIWDLENKQCIHTLEVASPVEHVIPLPGRPYIVTCSRANTIQLWSSTDFGQRATVAFNGSIMGMACFKDSGRIAFADDDEIFIMDINDEECSQKVTKQLCVSSKRQKRGDVGNSGARLAHHVLRVAAAPRLEPATNPPTSSPGAVETTTPSKTTLATTELDWQQTAEMDAEPSEQQPTLVVDESVIKESTPSSDTTIEEKVPNRVAPDVADYRVLQADAMEGVSVMLAPHADSLALVLYEGSTDKEKIVGTLTTTSADLSNPVPTEQPEAPSSFNILDTLRGDKPKTFDEWFQHLEQAHKDIEIVKLENVGLKQELAKERRMVMKLKKALKGEKATSQARITELEKKRDGYVPIAEVHQQIDKMKSVHREALEAAHKLYEDNACTSISDKIRRAEKTKKADKLRRRMEAAMKNMSHDK